MPSPAWPNFAAAIGVGGARPVAVELDFDGTRWSLDLDAVRAAIGPATRAHLHQLAGQPDRLDRRPKRSFATILALARERGIWIIADEVYSRFVYDGERAAVLLRRRRMGRPHPLRQHVLQELGDDRLADRLDRRARVARRGARKPHPVFTSGVAAFMQRAAVAALEEGEDFVRLQVERARRGRDIVCGALAGSNRVRFARPDGAFYLFFTVDGVSDTSRLGLDLVDQAAVGLAPGSTFGAGGAPFLRLCFARKAEDLTEATRRLAGWLGS